VNHRLRLRFCFASLTDHAELETTYSSPPSASPIPGKRQLFLCLLPNMLFRTAIALSVIAQASAYYFFPAVEDGVGQTPLGMAPPWRPPTDTPVKATPYPPPQAQDLVKPLLGNVSVERLHDDLEGLTSFLTRHASTKVSTSRPLIISTFR
jgi:hypothetical protein